MSGGPAGRRVERIGLGALLVVTLGVWWLQFEPFQLPNNDYASFEATARAFADGELPKRFQRMPILPAGMALLAPLLPGPHPYLTAALLLNVLFSLALLIALHALAEQLLGRGALLVPALFATTNQFHSMGLQPLVEPSLGFFVVLAFWLHARRSPWQYAAAAAAALSRYEAALVLVVFAVVNVLADRDARRHLGLAALAGVPFALWAVLGLGTGSGATWYLGLMEGVGFAPAPHFFVTSLKEPLRGWLGSGVSGWLLLLAAVGVPIAVGLATLARRRPRETAAMLLLYAGATTTVVFFGIDKGRYAFAYQWIPLLLFVAGVLEVLGPRLQARVAALPSVLRGALLVAATVGVAAGVRNGLRRLGDAGPGATPLVDELVVLGALAAIAGGLAVRMRTEGRTQRHAAALAVLVGVLWMLPLVTEGLRVKRTELAKIRWGNHGIVLAGDWILSHAAPEDRFVVLHKRHYMHRTGLPADRFTALMSLEATTLEEVAPEMRRRGLSHLIVTWRKPPAQANDHHHEQKFKWFLIDPLLRGEAAPGFTRVASLALPGHMERPPVRIFRVEPVSKTTNVTPR